MSCYFITVVVGDQVSGEVLLDVPVDMTGVARLELNVSAQALSGYHVITQRDKRWSKTMTVL